MTASAHRPDPLLPNVLLVTRREYTERVRSRLFVLSTALLALLAIGVAFIPLGVRVAERGTLTRIGIVSSDPALGAHTEELLGTWLGTGVGDGASGARAYEFVVSTEAAAANRDVAEGDLAGLLAVERRAGGGLQFQLLAGETLSSERTLTLHVALFGVSVLDWIESQGPDTGFVPPQVVTTAPAAGPAASAQTYSPIEFANRRIVGMVFGFLVFLTIVVYGMWVAAGVVAEKSSRVMEVLIAAASPAQLVVGKIAGIGLAGLSQLLVVLVPALVVLALQDQIGQALLGPSTSPGPSLAGLSPLMLAGFVGFFALGFALYAAIYAAAASLVSRPEDLQVIALPLSLIAIAGYLQAVLALLGGTAGFIRFASYVPFWSPFVMITRLSVGRVSLVEVLFSFGLLLVTVPLAIVVAVRVYRAGVLMYGQRPGFRTFLSAVRRAV